MKGAFALEETVEKLALVARPCGEEVDPMSILKIVCPITSVGVSVGIGVDTIAMFKLVLEGAFVAVSIFEDDRLPGLHSV